MTRQEIKGLLKTYSYSDYKTLYEKYSNWLISDKVEKSVIFPEKNGAIFVFEFRCNEEISFNNELRNNDLLVVVQIKDGELSITDYMFDVTTDPKSKVNGIAHTCEQIYRGNIGAHRGDSNRPCIRSDYGFGTWYNRTDSKGEVKDLNPSENFTSVSGHIGINIHNANGAYNSSLGCTILSNENEYQNVFRKVITSCSNKNNIPVALINANDLTDILQ